MQSKNGFGFLLLMIFGASNAQAESKSFRDCERICPEMVSVPPGEFVMGGKTSEARWLPQEAPRHHVVIPRALAIGKYDVTFDDWEACVADGGCNHYQPKDWRFGRGKRPVLSVNWSDAQSYLAWLSRKTGKSYRLLSEAEWEYAARAGSTTAYYWGDAVGNGNANCNGCGSQWDLKRTSPVGAFAPNAFGLHDMAGNVMQWVQDCWNPSYDGAPKDGSAWERGDCTHRMVRGGNWFIRPFALRSAFRRQIRSNERDDIFGFRVARVL